MRVVTETPWFTSAEPGTYWVGYRCDDCGATRGFTRRAYKRFAVDGYRDPYWPERDCDRCGKPYRGPAVFCSFACAIGDA